MGPSVGMGLLGCWWTAGGIWFCSWTPIAGANWLLPASSDDEDEEAAGALGAAGADGGGTQWMAAVGSK
jgi:hypothetical protein